MSPTAFQTDFDQLLLDIGRAYSMCHEIRRNRHMGSKTAALDHLQVGLKSSAQSLQMEFQTLRKLVGSRMDLGDELARHEIQRSTRAARDMQSKLENIAYRRTHGEHPGFEKKLAQWRDIERQISQTLNALANRIEYPTPVTTLPLRVTEERRAPKKDEVIISMKELERLLAQSRQSWREELSSSGLVSYVNVLNPDERVWERPAGFISYLPRETPVLARKGSFERRSPGTVFMKW